MEIFILSLIILVLGFGLIWLFSDEHCDKAIEKVVKEGVKNDK